MADIKPYAVRYKAGSDKTIRPGLHGRFETREEAEKAQEACARFFGGGRRNSDGFIIGRAIVGIVTDASQLDLQKKEAQGDRTFPEIEVPEEVDEVVRLKLELAEANAKLRELECQEEKSPALS